jgi:hypothetical protein
LDVLLLSRNPEVAQAGMLRARKGVRIFVEPGARTGTTWIVIAVYLMRKMEEMQRQDSYCQIVIDGEMFGRV